MLCNVQTCVTDTSSIEMRCGIQLQVVSVLGMNQCAVQNTIHHFRVKFPKKLYTSMKLATSLKMAKNYG